MDGNAEQSAASPLIPRGRYRGRPVDASSRHSIRIRTEDEAEPIPAQASHVMVDYFYHEGEFWSARIPLDAVEQVRGQAFNFSAARTRKGKQGREVLRDKHGLPKRTLPILNHVQCRFMLRPDAPVELYPLDEPGTGEPRHRLTDFVYSLEAVGPAGVLFGVRDGLQGSLISAHRFYSTQEMVFERIVVENQYVTESPPLPLSDRDRREVLVRSLLRSHRAGMTEPYYLYRFCGTNNCTSSPFRILDEVVQYGFLGRLAAALYRCPFHPRLYLRLRGLDSDPGLRRLVREQFQEYIQDPHTRRRKREYVRAQVQARRAARQDA